MQMKNIFLFIWYSLTFSRTWQWPAPGRSFSTIGGGGRGGVLPPTTPHFPPLPPPHKICVVPNSLDLAPHPPSPPSFLWCQFGAIRHHTWCRIASNWHHKNEGGEGGVVPNSFNLAPHKFCGGEVTGGSGGEVGGSGGQYPPAASSPNRGEWATGSRSSTWKR